MKLFMMSNIDRVGHNEKLYKQFLSNCSSICYIPAWDSKSVKKDYKDFVKSVKKDCSKVSFIPVDRKMSKRSKNNIQNADVIFIDGGNTFFLMKNLRKHGYFKLLKKLKNKTFVGVSAGAIALTKSIDLASIPLHSADDNHVELTNLKGLGFVDFEFHAHSTGGKKELTELTLYSKKKKNKIYLCKDGQGISVKNKKILLSGKADVMKNGKLTKNAGGSK